MRNTTCGPKPRRTALLAALLTVAFSTTLAADDGKLTRDEVMARFPTPEQLGPGWGYVADKPPVDMGFQMSAMYDHRDPETDKVESFVVDVRIFNGSADATKACADREELRRGQDQVVVDKAPSLGSTGFLWHHESNAKYGPRATFCERNLFVTVGPTPGSLELAETLYSAFR